MEEECALLVRYDAEQCAGMAHLNDAMVTGQASVSPGPRKDIASTDLCSIPDKDYCTHRLLIGTHTSNEAQNYLQIAHVQLPKPVTPDTADYNEESEEIGGHGEGTGKKSPAMEVKFDVVQKIDHKGEVNKARYQPQNPNIIATMCTDGRVMIWDRTKHPSLPTGHVSPEMELIGHTIEGFGLSWSPHEAGHLATGSEDKTVRLWWASPSGKRTSH